MGTTDVFCKTTIERTNETMMTMGKSTNEKMMKRTNEKLPNKMLKHDGIFETSSET